MLRPANTGGNSSAVSAAHDEPATKRKQLLFWKNNPAIAKSLLFTTEALLGALWRETALSGVPLGSSEFRVDF